MKRATDPVMRMAVVMFAVAGVVGRRGKITLGKALPKGRETISKPSPEPTTPPPIEHAPGLVGIARAVFSRFSQDNISLIAAGIAFYILAAIFPALAALVSIYGLFADSSQLANRVSGLEGVLPPEALKIITDGLNNFAHKSGSQLSFALLISLVIALWSARAGMSSVMTGLNIAYEETEKRSFVMQNVIALALTLGGIVFAIAAIIAVAVVPAALALLHADGFAMQILAVARWPALAVLVVIGFAVMYRYAPSRTNPNWTWISWGSGIAAVLWMAGSLIFSLYVSHFGSYQATYGALAAVVVLLLWFWVSALVLLLGAEIDDEISLRDRKSNSPLSAVSD